MSTLELKTILIHRILQIQDKSFLEAIKTIIESKTLNNTYHLSENQTESVEESKSEVAKGKTKSNDQLNEEINKWLSQK